MVKLQLTSSWGKHKQVICHKGVQKELDLWKDAPRKINQFIFSGASPIFWDVVSPFFSITCWTPSWYPSIKLLRASLYAEALIMYTRCKAGLNVSIPPLAARAIKFVQYKKNRLNIEKNLCNFCHKCSLNLDVKLQHPFVTPIECFSHSFFECSSQAINSMSIQVTRNRKQDKTTEHFVDRQNSQSCNVAFNS